jgi:CheY-like chemotaxis protein
VLVVDNDRDTADMLAMLLKFAKCEVRVAYDGFSALAEAATFHPDLLLADLAMPQMDGTELARRVRQCEGLDRTVLAALTGYADDKSRALAAAAGFTEYLVKPLPAERIGALLVRVAEMGATSRALVA